MRLPTPARAATAAGILLATSVLLLAGDIAVVQIAGDEANVYPFFVQDANFTVAGMRITNAGGHDTVRAYEMFASSACGYAYPTQVRLVSVDGNGTWQTPAGWNVTLRRTSPGDTLSWRDSTRVTGNVTFVVVESLLTPDFLRGKDVATYVAHERAGRAPDLVVTTGNSTGNVVRYVQVHVNCQRDGTVVIERGAHPGTSIRYAYSSSEPWLAQLPRVQGLDFLYIARASEQPDNETYAVLAENLQRGGEFWTYSMREATVFDDAGIVPDRILRVGIAATLAGAVACLALALRREPVPLPPTPTDAAFAVAAAGQSHLLRLRQTWGLVGALLVPLLGAATYVLFAVVPFTAPTPMWDQTIGAIVLVLDAAVLVLWGLAWLRAHRDLVAWRNAWTRMDNVDLDAL